MATEPHAVRKWLVVGAAVAGAAVGGATLAGAATSSSSSSTAPPTAAAAPTAPDPATVSHGPGETLLTGTTADKVKAAALAAVPGATIIRVETDSDGYPYEAHLAKADGSDVTVKVDASFNVTATVDGFGGGPGGGPGHGPAGGAATGG